MLKQQYRCWVMWTARVRSIRATVVPRLEVIARTSDSSRGPHATNFERTTSTVLNLHWTFTHPKNVTPKLPGLENWVLGRDVRSTGIPIPMRSHSHSPGKAHSREYENFGFKNRIPIPGKFPFCKIWKKFNEKIS